MFTFVRYSANTSTIVQCSNAMCNTRRGGGGDNVLRTERTSCNKDKNWKQITYI